MTIRPVSALWRREVLKFVRDRSRVIGVIGQPLGFWLVLGLGVGDSFRFPGAGPESSYLNFLFPGILLLTVLFTAIFSTISIVEERRSGFLQAAVVAPVSRAALLAGTLSGGVTLAILEAALLLLALPFLSLAPGLAGLAAAVGASVLAAVAFTSLGLIFAWRLQTTRGFHAVMNLLMLPLWLLSGAAFPLQGARPVVALAMRANPVTYLLDLLRHGLGGEAAAGASSGPLTALVVSLLFTAVLLALAYRAVARPPSPS